MKVDVLFKLRLSNPQLTVVASESCLLLSPWLYGTAGIWMISLFSVATEHLAIPLLMKYDSLTVSNQMAGSLTQLAV